MENLPEPPPALTAKLTAMKVFGTIAAGIFVLAKIINTICVAVIFIYIGSTIPAMRPYAGYVAFSGHRILGARTGLFVTVLLVGCYWCCLRLVAPKQAISSISKWALRTQETFFKLGRNNRKLRKVGRGYFAIAGVFNTCKGLIYVFGSWKAPDFRAQFVMGVIFLIGGAQSFQIAYVVGRMPKAREGARGENMTSVGNNDVTPGEYKDDDTTTR